MRRSPKSTVGILIAALVVPGVGHLTLEDIYHSKASMAAASCLSKVQRLRKIDLRHEPDEVETSF